jgi:glycosyltransferase involved in cell wall biosynthesis
MRVGLYTAVTPGPTTGVGRQLYGLLEGLSAVDRVNEYLLWHDAAFASPTLPANFRRRALPVVAGSSLANHLYQALLWPLQAARAGVALMHVPNTMPIVSRRPTVVTIHDLVEFALPYRVYPHARHHYRRLAARLAGHNATAIIATSENTRRDVIRYLGADPARVVVIHGGINRGVFHPLELTASQARALRDRYDLPEQFLLYVGKIHPRKNLVRILEAMSRLGAEQRGLRLVVAGARGWMDGDVVAAIARLGLERQVHFTGWISNDLPALYNLATMLVFPSLYEGFGFPLLEAMACGTPVVTASTSSLGEVAGEAALRVEPTSVEAIAEAIGRLLADAGLRQRLSAAGLARAADFTWQRCATATLACYQAVAARA